MTGEREPRTRFHKAFWMANGGHVGLSLVRGKREKIEHVALSRIEALRLIKELADALQERM